MSEKKRILIIDDEEDLVETMEMALEAHGYSVMTALDGEDGLKKSTQERPDVIVLDIMMPKMNGYQVCWELKNHDETKSLKVIMLTAKTQESDKFWGYETGADEYITKPFEMQELIQKIEELTNQSN